MRISTHHKGFSLIELVIMLAVTGVLMTIVISSTSSARASSRDGRRIGDLKQIQLGLALYYDVNRQYPATLSVLADPSQKYMPSIPVDPKTGSQYEYGRPTSTTYCLGATLENPNANPGDGSSCTTGGVANYKVQPPR